MIGNGDENDAKATRRGGSYGVLPTQTNTPNGTPTRDAEYQPTLAAEEGDSDEDSEPSETKRVVREKRERKPVNRDIVVTPKKVRVSVRVRDTRPPAHMQIKA